MPLAPSLVMKIETLSSVVDEQFDQVVPVLVGSGAFTDVAARLSLGRVQDHLQHSLPALVQGPVEVPEPTYKALHLFTVRPNLALFGHVRLSLRSSGPVFPCISHDSGSHVAVLSSV